MKLQDDRIKTSQSCPDYWPLTPWQKLLRWLGFDVKPTICVYMVGSELICSPRTYLRLKELDVIEYRKGYP